MSAQAHARQAEFHIHGRLLKSLTARAARFGSRDPESAAQEALKRSLQHAASQAAVEYYFAEQVPTIPAATDWSLDQLFAWLHAVLRFVVREEQARAGFRNEVSAPPDPLRDGPSDPRDPSPDQLDDLIETERRQIIGGCLPRLCGDYRTVIEMRMEGMAYNEIAEELEVNQNTVATWIARGIRLLADCVRRRMGRAKGFHDA